MFFKSNVIKDIILIDLKGFYFILLLGKCIVSLILGHNIVVVLFNTFYALTLKMQP